jgi:hypothetical protein
MTFKKPTSKDNKNDKLISTGIILTEIEEIESQIVTRIVRSTMPKQVIPYYDTFITLEDPSRFMFNDVLSVILGKIPKDNAIYNISFEFFGRSFKHELMYSQKCKLSTYSQLYVEIYKTYMYIVEKYDYSYMEKFEIRIEYVALKGELKGPYVD